MSRLSAALSSATQHAMPPEFGRKWGTECLNTSFPLPTLLCAGYSVKLISNHNHIATNKSANLIFNNIFIYSGCIECLVAGVTLTAAGHPRR